MGRKKVINRQHVLDVAEEIVSTEGAARLTIESVARAAGISKGGVQSCFGTKEALVEAMLQRWNESYEAAFLQLLTEPGSGIDRVRAHVAVTRNMTDEANARAATFMALLLQSPAHLAWQRNWYRERIAGLDTTSHHGRNARLAFLAMEGAFLLRFFGLMDLDDAWDPIGADIAALIDGCEVP